MCTYVQSVNLTQELKHVPISALLFCEAVAFHLHFHAVHTHAGSALAPLLGTGGAIIGMVQTQSPHVHTHTDTFVTRS